MAGYKDMDELFRLTKKSFSNLIREDGKNTIEANIGNRLIMAMEMIYPLSFTKSGWIVSVCA